MGELQRDNIDRQMHRDQVPKWPERCRQCLTENSCDPDEALFCPPDKDCPHYPFVDKTGKLLNKAELLREWRVGTYALRTYGNEVITKEFIERMKWLERRLFGNGYHKGEQCVIKPEVLCQEGWCCNCALPEGQ